jgi:hypothetical protein
MCADEDLHRLELVEVPGYSDLQTACSLGSLCLFKRRQQLKIQFQCEAK